jgi:hypothetical protein
VGAIALMSSAMPAVAADKKPNIVVIGFFGGTGWFCPQEWP